MKPRKFANVWAERVQKLMWATGETQPEMAKRFGVCRHVILRIVTGKRSRFSVSFVRRLQALEAQFAEDLAALKAGKIKIEYSARNHWRRFDTRRIKAEGSRQTLGDVGLSREPVSGPASKTVYFSYDSRNHIKINRTVEAGRPAAGAGGPTDARQGISGC